MLKKQKATEVKTMKHISRKCKTLTAVLAAVFMLCTVCGCGELGDDLLGDIKGGVESYVGDAVEGALENAKGEIEGALSDMVDGALEEAVGTDWSGIEDAISELVGETESRDDGQDEAGSESQESTPEEIIEYGQTYTSAEDVALYLHTYDELPPNFITKKAAKALGWPGGSLEEYAPGKCIGGDHFGNYDGLLPEKQGRSYKECDIDTLGAAKRGAKRLVWSNDGLIYYTDDHYETFTLLYGEE